LHLVGVPYYFTYIDDARSYTNQVYSEDVGVHAALMVTPEFINYILLVYVIKCFYLNPSELINLLKTLFLLIFYYIFNLYQPNIRSLRVFLLPAFSVVRVLTFTSELLTVFHRCQNLPSRGFISYDCVASFSHISYILLLFIYIYIYLLLTNCTSIRIYFDIFRLLRIAIHREYLFIKEIYVVKTYRRRW
jgi:hypothetical protein